jgi:uncharacterized glyoxalase superfamily protein PhnB
LTSVAGCGSRCGRAPASRTTRTSRGRPAPASTERSLGHNVASSAEVDAAMADARRAGASIIVEAHDTFWGGYAGYFADTDGHLWEVVWNPAWVKE